MKAYDDNSVSRAFFDAILSFFFNLHFIIRVFNFDFFPFERVSEIGASTFTPRFLKSINDNAHSPPTLVSSRIEIGGIVAVAARP